ncbi:MAG: PP2C family protein-serine/threonine phosphatase [Acidobacteria bacterium]|nr:PP2C family protein-serine/threonine phosphatase [Acidobacteriota bacterium]
MQRIGASALAADKMERRTMRLLDVLVGIAIAAVAVTDWEIVANISLGYLYVLPIALCALINPLSFTLGLSVFCTVLQDIFGPPAQSLEWRVVRDIVYLSSFLIVGFCVTLLARQRNRMADEVKRQRDEYESDLTLAAQVQRQVLPKPLSLSDMQIAAAMQPARMLGGDYYDFFEVGDNQVDVVIADVSGKGAAAALLMPSLAVALRLRARELDGPAAIIKDLDEVLKQITRPATFVTMFYARIHRSRRTLQYACAGHNPPILLRAKSGEEIALNDSGPVLGILPDARFSDSTASLEPGDVLTLYTDGVTEQENNAEEEFSPERLQSVIAETGTETASSVVNDICLAVSRFSGDKEQADDLTVVVVKML